MYVILSAESSRAQSKDLPPPEANALTGDKRRASTYMLLILRAIPSHRFGNTGRAVLLAVCTLVCCACSENRDYKEFTSPDGQTTAWLFIREGNVTTAPSYQISIGKSKPIWIGNIYVQQRNEEVGVKWLGNTELEITTSPQATILRHASSFNKIVIHYKTQ
jgi:hypothetical protein